MIAILTLAFALRVPLLDGPRFHPDEALFASFARAIAVWRDPLLAAASVDKPPLLFYLQALCYPFLGPVEMAARLFNLFASLLTVALTYAVSCRLARSVRPLGSLAAAALVALSPLAIAFGPTAFTDPLMVAWGMAAVLAASKSRPGWAGFWLGLGLATKYQAILFLPLLVGLLWLPHESPAARRPSRQWMRLVGGISLPVAAVVAWELARAGRFSLLSAQLSGYGGVRLLSPDEWWPRLVEWVELARYLATPAWGALLLALLLPWLLVRRRRPSAVVLSLLLLGWLSGYFLLHWLLNINPWDRYLLPAVPVVGVLAGWSAGEWIPRHRPLMVRALPLVLLVILALPAAGALPLGGDHGTFDGIEQVADFFEGHPYGTVLYDHWLSWELRYYLFDSRVYVSWFPNPAALVKDLQAFGVDPPRYLLVPTWQPSRPIIQELEAAGFKPSPVLRAARPDSTSSFIVYTITH
jgi:4-amino-4-deoxy-L-arabinose transferase-like glycosyltransferase